MLNKGKQSGLSLISVLIVGAFLVFALLLGFRSVPAITEYMELKRIINFVAAEGENGASVADMRRSFDRRAEIGDVKSVKGADLLITKEGSGVSISTEYSRVVPIAGNVSLLFDFHAVNDR
jgi:hypothetical protein